MNAGNVVEFIDSQKIICAVVMDIKKMRLRLLTEHNREVKLSVGRLSHLSNTHLDLAAGRDKTVAALKEIAAHRRDLSSHIDILTLWEVLNSEQEQINLPTMTDFCFPDEPDSDHQSAVIRAFFQVFLLQGMLIIVVSLPVTIAITSERSPLSLLDILGVCIWFGGFAFESVGDYQLMRYKGNAANQGKIMTKGLWKYTRHPNYFGEIVIWVGVAIIALPVLRGWQWVTLISPVFVTLLLTRISGVPILEKRADEKWGGREDYEAYKERTPVLIPRPPTSGSKSRS